MTSIHAHLRLDLDPTRGGALLLTMKQFPIGYTLLALDQCLK